jgi:hypothetical protein
VIDIDETMREFMPKHYRTFRFLPFPEIGTDEWDSLESDWRKAFIRNGLRLDALLEASSLLSEEMVSWEKHFPRLIQLGHIVAKARNAVENGGVADSRLVAVAASLDCPDCHGGGLTGRYRHKPAGDGLGRNAPGFLQPFYCTCQLGQWMFRAVLSGSPELKGRALNLADYPKFFLRPLGDRSLGNPHCYPPDAWDVFNDSPMPPDSHYPADLAKKYATVKISEVLSKPHFKPQPQPIPVVVLGPGEEEALSYLDEIEQPAF